MISPMKYLSLTYKYTSFAKSAKDLRFVRDPM